MKSSRRSGIVSAITLLVACGAQPGWCDTSPSTPSTDTISVSPVDAPADSDSKNLSEESPPESVISGEAKAEVATVDDIDLLSIEELMNVRVTSVSRNESTVGQSAAAIFVITQEMIARSGATQIPELFRMVPGMTVARINSHQWAISIRAFNTSIANKLLVQVDGRTVYDPIFAGTYWDSVDYPLEDIDRIEVIRGPGGSVWGANAFNGVVNIITKKASDTQGGLLKAGMGTQEGAFGTVRHGDKSGAAGHYRAYVKGFGDQEIRGDSENRWNSSQAGFRYDRSPEGKTAFTMQGDYRVAKIRQRINHANINDPTATPPFSASDTSPLDSTNANLLARWTKDELNGGWSLQAFYDRVERTQQGGLSQFTIDTADIDFQRQVTRGARQRLIFGAGYRFQRIDFKGSNFDNGFAIGPAFLKTNRDVASAFVQDEIKVRDDLTLTLGSKVEHNFYNGFEFEPSARLLFSRSPRHSAWASVSRAARTPSVLEHDLQISTSPLLLGATPVFLQLMPNPNLSAEHVLAFEMGYRAQATDRLSVDATVFYNKYSDLVVSNPLPGLLFPGPVPGTAVLPLQYVNGESGRQYGVELSSSFSVNKRWKLYGAYTYQRLNLTLDPGISPFGEGLLLGVQRRSPRNQVYLMSSHDFSSKFHLDVVGRYVGRLTDNGIPSYVTADLQLTCKVKEDLNVSIVGQNLLGGRHQEFGGDPTNVLIGRSVYVKATQQW